MPRHECIECMGCQQYYCDWCEEPKPCRGCEYPMCEDCQDEFTECEGCKNNFCLSCTEDSFAKCSEEGCEFFSCKDCLDSHSEKHVDESTDRLEANLDPKRNA